jgi:hypothetical protein
VRTRKDSISLGPTVSEQRQPPDDLAPVVVAREFGLMPGLVLPPSVVVRRCAGCGARVLVTASVRQMLASGLFRVTCEPCYTAWAGGRDLPRLTVVIADEDVGRWLAARDGN